MLFISGQISMNTTCLRVSAVHMSRTYKVYIKNQTSVWWLDNRLYSSQNLYFFFTISCNETAIENCSFQIAAMSTIVHLTDVEAFIASRRLKLSHQSK